MHKIMHLVLAFVNNIWYANIILYRRSNVFMFWKESRLITVEFIECEIDSIIQNLMRQQTNYKLKIVFLYWF